MDDDGGGGGHGSTSYALTEHMLLAGTPNQQNMEKSSTSSTPQQNLTPMNTNALTPPNSTPSPPRLKAYPPNSSGPYVVFFRPKQKKLNTSQISKDLTKRFSSVISIDTVGTSKLRVTVGDRRQANEIVSSEHYTLEYKVYLPAASIEIAGVVTDGSQTCDEIMQGAGFFRNRSLPPVQILECRQMHSVSQQGEERVFTPSESFRVTFAGPALPDYVIIDKLRLPVRLYVPKVMNCVNCKQLGHTAQYCCNKPRCEKCGERHVDGACKSPPKCVYCNGDPPHALDACPTYIQQRSFQRRSLQQHSRRSYAEMVKKFAPSLESTNIYSSLSLDDQGSDSEVGDGVPFVMKGMPRKRPRVNQRTPKKPRKLLSSGSRTNMNKSKAGRKVPTCTPPGFKFQEEHDFPLLPGTVKNPAAPIFSILQPERQQQKQQEHPQGASMFTLSGIVDFILNFFNASDPVKNLVKGILPCVTPLLKQLASKMPLLATIISFDG